MKKLHAWNEKKMNLKGCNVSGKDQKAICKMRDTLFFHLHLSYNSFMFGNPDFKTLVVVSVVVAVVMVAVVMVTVAVVVVVVMSVGAVVMVVVRVVMPSPEHVRIGPELTFVSGVNFVDTN